MCRLRRRVPHASEPVAAGVARAQRTVRGNGRRVSSQRLLRMRKLQLRLPRQYPAGSILPPRETDEPPQKGARMKSVIELRTSPHLHAPLSVRTIMLNVVLALLPVSAYAIWLFG